MPPFLIGGFMFIEAHVLAMIDTMKEIAEDVRKFEDSKKMNEAAGVRARNKIEPLRKNLQELRRMMLAVRKDRIEKGLRTK